MMILTFVELTQTNPGERLLRVVSEISVLNPTVIAWVLVQYLGDRTALVLAEIEDLLLPYLTVLVFQRLTFGIQYRLP